MYKNVILESMGFIYNPAVTFIAGVVCTRLVEYMFDRFKDRRDMRIVYGSPDVYPRKLFYVKNTGAKDINPTKNGFKYIGESEREFPLEHFFVFEHLKSDRHWNLSFRDIASGDPPIEPDLMKLEYVFVKDSEGWSKRLYFQNGLPLGRLSRIARLDPKKKNILTGVISLIFLGTIFILGN